MSDEKVEVAVTPKEVAVNPLLSGLNSPVLGQNVLKAFIALQGVAVSITGLKLLDPDSAALLPEQVVKVAQIINLLGIVLAPLFPGLRKKADAAGVAAAAEVKTLKDAAAELEKTEPPAGAP